MKCYYSGCEKKSETLIAEEPYCREHYLEIFDTLQSAITGKKLVTIRRILRHFTNKKVVIFHAPGLCKELNILPSTLDNHLKRLAALNMVERVDNNGFWRVLSYA